MTLRLTEICRDNGPALLSGFPAGSVVKNTPANIGDIGSFAGSGRSPEEGKATHTSIPVWQIPQTEEPGGLHV